MARKALRNTAKALGGLGAAYALANALGPKVRPEDVNPEDAAKYQQAMQGRTAQSRSMSPAPPATFRSREALDTLRENLERRIEEDRFARGKPVVSEEEIVEAYEGIPGVRSGTGLPVKVGDELLQTGRKPANFKKGGAVKGWGKARSARAAKVY